MTFAYIYLFLRIISIIRMQVFIRGYNHDEKTIVIMIDENETYSRLKQFVCDKKNVPCKIFQLVYQSDYIEHHDAFDKTMKELNIINNATIDIRYRICFK